MEISHFLREKILEIVKAEYKLDVKPAEIEVSRPGELLWGDYSTNIAMKLSNVIKQPATEIAKKLSYELAQISSTWNPDGVEGEIFEKIDFQEPGFINFMLSEKFLANTVLTQDQNLQAQKENLNIGQYRGKNVLFEYTDPNLFKAFHIGHLVPNAIGEALSRIYEFAGSNVRRVNYQSDVGLNVAKSIWGAIKSLNKDKSTIDDKDKLTLSEKIGFLGDSYVSGNKAYDADPAAKGQIQELNYLVYIAAQERLEKEENWKSVVDYKQFLAGSHTFSYELVKEIYHKGRKWSLESFEKIYAVLGTKFDHLYFEGMVGEYGLKIVNEYVNKGVFKKDQGAIIFPGEEYGLHTRVFVNSFGLPTYEAKDLGLATLKAETFKYDLSFVITGNEINEYFKVLLKALEQIRPDLSSKTIHIGHGMLRFKDKKMSSRTGEILPAEEFLESVKEAVLEQMDAGSSHGSLNAGEKSAVAESLAVSAIKYSILKQGLGKDIIFDKEQSISITGNTGPYLQYTHARANSILEKAADWNYDPAVVLYESEGKAFQEREKGAVRHLSKFVDVVEQALFQNSPNLVCEYLFGLSQHYNALYNDLPILTETDARARTIRLQITKQVRDLLKTGLWILGIQAPDRV